jgi:hypothetical protein
MAPQISVSNIAFNRTYGLQHQQLEYRRNVIGKAVTRSSQFWKMYVYLGRNNHWHQWQKFTRHFRNIGWHGEWPTSSHSANISNRTIHYHQLHDKA